jgi:hypothetical protein
MTDARLSGPSAWYPIADNAIQMHDRLGSSDRCHNIVGFCGGSCLAAGMPASGVGPALNSLVV